MFRIAPMVVVLLVAALVVGCGDGGEEAEVTPTGTASDVATASPMASVVETATPIATPQPSVAGEVGGRRIVFLRNDDYYSGQGELWISRLDGNGRERLSNEGEIVTFAGIASDYSTGNETVYYVSKDGDFGRTLSSLDQVTGERSVVLSFEAFREDQADASVSPDGRYVAYAHAGGVDMLDTASGATKHLLDNGPSYLECDARSCFMHSRPRWSPDGTLLIVRKTFWEGGTTVVVHPFVSPIETYTNDSPVGPSTAEWSGSDDVLCGFGRYAAPSGLYIADGQPWSFVNVLPHYEEDYPGQPFIASCSWLDDGFVAFAVNVSRQDPEGGVLPVNSVELRVFDREAQADRLITEDVGERQIWTGEVLALSGTSFIVTQRLVDDDGNGSGEWTQPELIDVETGERTLVLEEGDVLVGLAP